MAHNGAHGLPERNHQPHPLWSRRARHYDDDDGCEQPSTRRQPRRCEGPPQDIVFDDEASVISRITTPTFVTATSTTIESPPPPNHSNNKDDDTTIKSVGATSTLLPPPSKEGDTLNSINEVDIEEADDDDYDRASAYSAPFPPPESLGPSHSNFPQSSGGSTVYPGAVAHYPSPDGRVRSPESLNFSDNDNMQEERRQHRPQQQQEEGQLPEALPAEDYIVTEAIAITRPTSLVRVDSNEKDEYDDDTERIHSTSTTTEGSFLGPILGKFSKRTSLILSIIVLIGILSVIIAVIAGVATSRGSGDGDGGASVSQNPPLSPTLSPTTTSQNHLKEYVDVLSSRYNLTVDRRDLSNMSSPQYRALSWLALDDEFLSSLDDPDMMERYILAVFYFSTDGENWDTNNQWLTESHICEWWGVVGCTNGMRVTLFDMGTYVSL